MQAPLARRWLTGPMTQPCVLSHSPQEGVCGVCAPFPSAWTSRPEGVWQSDPEEAPRPRPTAAGSPGTGGKRPGEAQRPRQPAPPGPPTAWERHLARRPLTPVQPSQPVPRGTEKCYCPQFCPNCRCVSRMNCGYQPRHREREQMTRWMHPSAETTGSILALSW